MSKRGYYTWVTFLRGWGKYLILCAVLLIVYMFRKKVTISDKTIPNEVYNLLRFNGFSDNLAKFATAQSAHETNAWSSFIYNSNNNAFGMKYAKQPDTIGAKFGYANYENLAQSVLDYSKWFGRRNGFVFGNIPTWTIVHFVQWLKIQKYYEDSYESYLRGVEYWYKQLYG